MYHKREVILKMKKLVILLLAAVLMLALSACSGTPAGSNDAAPAQDADGSFQTGDNAAPPAAPEDEGAQPDETPDTEPKAPSEPEGAEEGSRVLVAYFSVTNNTEGVAEKLADGLGANLYEILPQQPYTDADLNYGDPNSRSSAEMNDPAARPAIAGEMPPLEQYDMVLIGYPIWWGEAPRIMSTFIESGDFSGKTIAAFCTSASSGFGSSDAALRAAAGTANWLDGCRFSAGASAEEILEWAGGLD